MIQRNCSATATEIRYFEAMDVGLMLRSFRVVMITTVGKWRWVRAIGRSRRHTDSQTLFLSGDVYTLRHCHVHVQS